VRPRPYEQRAFAGREIATQRAPGRRIHADEREDQDGFDDGEPEEGARTEGEPGRPGPLRPGRGATRGRRVRCHPPISFQNSHLKATHAAALASAPARQRSAGRQSAVVTGM
jgi:hypothetical protein